MSETTLQLELVGDGLSAELEFDGAMNYALAHNAISPLRSLNVENGSGVPVRDLQLDITISAPVDGRIATPLRVTLPTIEAHESFALDGRDVRWTFDPTTFAQLDEAVGASLRARLFDATRMLQAEGTLRLLARDEWWMTTIREALAAFVTPRARAIADLVGDASDILGQTTGDPSVQGYQGGADRAMAIAAAIYDAMRARDIRYINPPPSFEHTGQKIRTPHEVLVDRWGTCLDLATTHAAALEHAGLHPVLVLCEGHAFSGHLLEELQLPELVVSDPRIILNHVESGIFVPVETTKLCAGENSGSFSDAVQETRERGYWTSGINRVLYLIDVAAAHRSVRPLPTVSVQDGVRVVEVERHATTAPRASVRKPSPEPEATPRGGARPKRAYPPRVERWRSALLDLSFSNPLLNLRTGRGALDLHVPHGSLGTFEDLLFAGRSLNLVPHDQLAEIHVARGARTAQDIDAQTLHEMLVKDSVAFAACTQAAYVTRLRGIQRRARTVIEETGANNLFLTLGTLEWEDAKRQARAPLFLLPVTLKANRGRPYTLQIEEGGYAQPNQCLLEKLRIGSGLSIPEFADPETDESGIDLAGALHAIRLALVDARLPFAVEETAHLALLQFSTLQLWQDLSENWETFLLNPVVKHLVETPTDSFADPAEAMPVRPDAEARAFCPISIDGSQLQAVAKAEAGHSFVLEGPPGTGKSQTITNLIANALAMRKTVLFVAEKQAALDVVRHRLDRVGLGELCLDLHGKNQTPETMRKQLRAALHKQVESNREAWAAVRSRHQTSVDSLNRYPAALHEPGPAGLSAWTGRQALLTAGEGPETTIPTSVVSRTLDTEALYADARELTQALYDLGTTVDAHPWRLAELDDVDAHRERITRAVAALAAVDRELDPGVAALIESAGADLVIAWLGAVTAAPGFTVTAQAIEEAARPEWRTQVEAAKRRTDALREDAASLLRTFTSEVIDADLDALLIRAKAADSKLFKGKARKAIAAELTPVTRDAATIELGTLTPTLEALIALRASVREARRDVDALAGLSLPAGWNLLAEAADDAPQGQIAVIDAAVRLAAEASPAAVANASAGPAQLAQANALRGAWNALTEVLASSPSALDVWRAGRPALRALRNSLPAWQADTALVQLGRWACVHVLLARMIDRGLDAFVADVFSGALALDELEPILRRSVARAALAERLSSPALAGFDGVARDRSIQRFAAGADEMRSDMLAELPAKILAERAVSAERLVGKAGQLSRELSRKRGGQKIRELFTNFGPIIGELTPCLMMSPHSVARFLPADALGVDLVVFDEASQIRVAEAISALGRAKATVVVGDSQQMPPSNLMAASGAEDEAPPDTGVPADMESVLSEAVESNLPRIWLSWHYRSRHESLIAFSNDKYYDGRLSSFPRAPEERSGFGVGWRRVDGTYERGRERVNRVEANVIVEEIRRRLAEDEAASIGVVTFNVQQRDLIMDLLEECGDPLVAAALAAEDDALFVKNLENVQGDERDVILFSLAFSPDPVDGKLPLNFGPLNRAGGERRLNVAITRARAQVMLFSSFDPQHIDLSRSSALGLAHLRSYMEMAERQADDSGILRPPIARDLHHDDVVAALTETGLHVRRDVGLSEFRIDVAVAAQPEGPWVAVFLDGPTYARRVTVADRESLPHGVLTGSMGWSRVERVWLPDWARDREEVIARLVRAANAPEPDPEPAAPSTPTTPVDAVDPVETIAPLRGAPRAAEPEPTHAARAEPPAFVPAAEGVTGDREWLDLFDHNAEARRIVRAEVEDVIATEGPVASVRLARIVGRRFGLQRVVSARSATIAGLIPHESLERTPFGDYAWPPGQDPAAYEAFRLTPAGVSRAIEEIAPREVVNAMRYLATVGLGISRDELVRETAALFGVQRPSGKREHLEAMIDYGVRTGMLDDDGSAISVRNGSGPATS